MVMLIKSGVLISRRTRPARDRMNTSVSDMSYELIVGQRPSMIVARTQLFDENP